jgi:putative YhdH/YhfP family quinone oxidoreductase
MNNISDFNDIEFESLEIREQKDGKYFSCIRSKSVGELPEGDLLIKVDWSGLNYKDALSASGHKGITRHYPHTPGIDAAGTVVASLNADFSAGDEVIVTGYDLGMNTSGGFAGYIRVPSAWAVKLPAGLSLKESMIIGTSGFTAASAIFEFLKHGVKPESGNVLVSGASGAVGSIAVAMLARNGYTVIASSGKPELEENLKHSSQNERI